MLGCGYRHERRKFRREIDVGRFFAIHPCFVLVIMSAAVLALGCGSRAKVEEVTPETRGEATEPGRQQLATESGMSRAMLEELRRIAETYPDSAYVRYRLGRKLMEESQWEEARRVLDEAIRLDEGLVDAYFDLAWCYYNLRMPREQLRVYDQLLRRENDLPSEVRANLHTYAGNVHTQLLLKGDKNSSTPALKHYREAHRIAPDAAGPMLGEGRVLLALQRWREAEETFRRVLRSSPGPRSRALALEGLANVAWHAHDDRDTAEEYLRKARQEDPTGNYAIREFLQPD